MCDAADSGAMDDDPPPPYTEYEYETKINPALQPTGPTSFKPQDGQTLPLPSAPPEFQAVIYHPTTSLSGGASVLLQPQPQQQVVVIQPAPVVVAPPTPAQQSFTPHIWASCLSCFLCCWACPCSALAFVLASKCAKCFS